MQTNVVLDSDLIKEAQKLTGIKTKKEVIHQALVVFIRLQKQSQGRSLRGKLKWEGNFDAKDDKESKI